MNSTGKIRKITNISMSVAILTICSWISIPIGSVPFTLQTLAVTMLVIVLGKKDALISLTVYILIGLIGLPVFAGFAGGVSVFMTPAGGFLIGFIPMILISEALMNILNKNNILKTLAACVGTLSCYACGVIYTCFLYVGKGQPAEIGAILMMCVVPYVVVDIIKNYLAVVLAERIKKII